VKIGPADAEILSDLRGIVKNKNRKRKKLTQAKHVVRRTGLQGGLRKKKQMQNI